MKYDPYRHNRQSIRLDNHDYKRSKAYFVTICVWRKNIIFGEIQDGKTILNRYGEAVRQTWEDLPNHNAGVMLDAFSAKRINKLRNTKGVPVWQRNYHEHILRIDELDIFRKYIRKKSLA